MEKIVDSSCFLCKRFTKCSKPKTAICEKFVEYDITKIQKLVDDYEEEYIETEDERVLDLIQIYNTALEGTELVSSSKVLEYLKSLPKANSFLEFATDKKFLNITPFVSQLVYGTKLFQDYCPNCSDIDYLENFAVDDTIRSFKNKICTFVQERCPNCGKYKIDFVKQGLLFDAHELVAVVGQRGGKTASIGGMLTPYIVHRMLCLGNVIEVYKLLDASILTGTFTGVTFNQAKNQGYDTFLGAVDKSPWFINFHQKLDEIKEKLNLPTPLYKKGRLELKYNYHRLRIAPETPDKKILRGYTRFFATCDELGWWPNDPDKVKTAQEIYTSLNRSLTTVRNAQWRLFLKGFTQIPTAYMLNISSPSAYNDPIMTLLRKSEKSDLMVGFHYATWEVNPELPPDSPDIKEAFLLDPVLAKRDYGAEPPIADNAFFTNYEIFEGCYSKFNGTAQLIQKKLEFKNKKETYAILNYITPNQNSSILALDAGRNNNSFAFAIGYLKKLKNDSIVPFISHIGEIIPSPGEPINFYMVYENVFRKIFENVNIKIVAADRWNSVKILDDLAAEYGVTKNIYSLKLKDFYNLKESIYSKEIRLPLPTNTIDEIMEYNTHDYPMCFKGKPENHLMLQFLTVRESVKNLEKGDGLTDDLFRAVALCFSQLLDGENRFVLNGIEEDFGQRPAELGIYLSNASGGNTSQAEQVFLNREGKALGFYKRYR